ncbi:hypothetical protein Taro_039834 [Colocasia esculenta]|uniref:Uncharacterized protein n=1 Tax=Colocasia esculenta TaxID=4460 RepID=A0A843W7F9_COLES|nr:hypothetical protein [Colocasia esculenta]
MRPFTDWVEVPILNWGLAGGSDPRANKYLHPTGGYDSRCTSTHALGGILAPEPKELGITFRTGIGIAYVTTIRNQHSETVDKALVSRNSVPGPKFPP